MKKILLLAVAVLFIGLVMLLAVRPKLEPDPPLPNPNGYDDFMKAATMVNSRTPDWNELGAADLASLVATNKPALELVRGG